MLSHTAISRFIVLVLLIGLAVAFISATNVAENDKRVVREYYECIAAVCVTLDGVGEACTMLGNTATKVTIVDEWNQGKTIKILPGTDRCN